MLFVCVFPSGSLEDFQLHNYHNTKTEEYEKPYQIQFQKTIIPAKIKTARNLKYL